jgi:hypothetical protein
MGQKIVIAQQTVTATNNSVDQNRTVTGGAGHLIINMTAVPGVQTVTPKLQGKDAMGNYYDILTGPAIVATGQTVLKLGIGMLAAANSVANDALPDTWRVVCTHSGAGSFGYNVCWNDTALN